MQEENHISTLIQQNKMLMEMMCSMQIELKDLTAKINNIHRIFNTVPDVVEKHVKKLSPAKQRLQDLENRKQKEKLEMIIELRKN